jgi:hypothetical protein
MSKFCNVARDAAVVTAMLVALTGCGGGGGSDNPQGSNPPPPSTSPPPASPPPSSPSVPPLSTTVVDLSDNHAVGADRWAAGNTAEGGQGGEVDGMACLLNMPEAYHVHAHLAVFVDSVQSAIPNNIGIHNQEPSRCFYGIHTHDKSGKIHVEFGAPGVYTMGNLFHIWGQSLTSDNFAGLTGKPVKVFVTDNGTTTEVTSDWGQIELTTHKLITVQVGSAITEIPNYNWNGN